MPELNTDLLSDAVAYIDWWLEYQQQLKEIPAVVVAVRHADAVILSKGYGHANLEHHIPVTPNYIFRVASHSKWFTATALLQLRERGKLRLDDALTTYIPWLPGPFADVTIRQVLNHAAGITRDGYDNDHWQLEIPFPDPEQVRRLTEEGGKVLASNDKLKYSNIGYSLLGMVVEAAGAIPYNRFVQENIVDRLGLTSTGPETTREVQTRMVTGYTSRRLLLPRMPLPDVETRAMSSATGFYSTAEDLTRYAAAHFFGNEELLSDVSKREMQRPYWPVEGMDSYGLGMQVVTVGSRRLVGHSGGFPGHTTRTYLDPVDKLAVSVLTNESGGFATELTHSIVKLIDLALKQDPAGDSTDLDRYTGRFTNLWGYTDLFRLGNQLFTAEPTADDPASVAVKLEIVNEATLRIEEKDGYGSPGESVRYVRDVSGNITKISVAGSTHYPAGTMREYLQRRREDVTAAAGSSGQDGAVMS
ncbi:MAG: serine hydrolase domain-containing protein [Chloroflexota bacterium]